MSSRAQTLTTVFNSQCIVEGNFILKKAYNFLWIPVKDSLFWQTSKITDPVETILQRW